MPAKEQPQIETFLHQLSRAPQSLLMLDYDGTLAPFHQRRDQAYPYAGITSAVRNIMQPDTGTRLVIISGRDAAEVVPLLGVHPSPEIWGLHGLQRRKPDGTLITAALDESVLDALSDAGRWLGYQQLQHLAEAKTGSIAVHWRGMSENSMEDVRGRILLGWSPIAARTGLDLMEFDGGVEIRAPAADKGDAVRLLLDEAGRGTPAAYFGDDATDEHAFEAIRGRGLSVLVRPRWRHTAAQAWLKPGNEVLAFLTQWWEACRQRSGVRDPGRANERLTGARDSH
ncbi:MAG TPA: trehalose-phosphatase [Terriglobales bacterium]|nr:trehalose-phosphatase [Terriglobales bacterium]